MEKKKYRHELKYVCSQQQLILIESRIKTICRLDAHVEYDGTYMIRSVYFDDLKNSCFYENENGIDPREKFRIRIYNGNLDRIVLECKQKQSGMTHKESCMLSRELCSAILDGTWNPDLSDYKTDDAGEKLLRKFALKYRKEMFRPKVIVQYERTPYVYHLGNVRITFDRHISSSTNIADFFEEKLNARPVMPLGQHVLEVKYDEFLPDYLYNVMQIGKLRQTAYSKYYICRRISV